MPQRRILRLFAWASGTVECRADGFFLNGKKHKLMGLNRHQSYPYIGYAAPARVQKKDADILKNYLHLTVVRTSHYMQAEEFLDPLR